MHLDQALFYVSTQLDVTEGSAFLDICTQLLVEFGIFRNMNKDRQSSILTFILPYSLFVSLSLTFLAPEIAFINYPFESRHNAHEVKSRVSDLDHHGNLFKRGDRSDGKVKMTDDSPPCQRTFRQFGLTRTLKNITDESVPKVTFT